MGTLSLPRMARCAPLQYKLPIIDGRKRARLIKEEHLHTPAMLAVSYCMDEQYILAMNATITILAAANRSKSRDVSTNKKRNAVKRENHYWE